MSDHNLCLNERKDTMGPDPNKARPNPDIPGLVYIKNIIKNPNIIVGDYTYYFDTTGTDNF